MTTKALCITLLVCMILISGGNHLAVSPFIDGKEKCTCEHLEALKADLANALALQQAFRNKIPELQKMSKGAAGPVYQEFAKDLGRTTQKPPGYTGPDTVDYTPEGDNKDNEALREYTNEQLCEPTPGAKLELERAESGSICEAMARAIRAHEDFHQQMCRSIGYRAYGYRTMHPADRAREEVEAYEAQIEVLRAEIKKLEGKENRIEMKGKYKIEAGPPVGTEVVQVTGDYPFSIDENDKISGTGQFTVAVSLIDSQCQISWHGDTFRFSLSGQASPETLTFKITPIGNVTVPSLLMTCPKPTGTGGSLFPITLLTPQNDVKMPRKDGERYVVDYGKLTNGIVTGEGITTLHLCSEEKTK